MGALRQRLSWTDDGALHDGPRRYLMMRTDVMMGTLLRLPAATQAAVLQAWAASTCEQGADSLKAYLQMCAGDDHALTDATVQAAADLGWGRWTVAARGQDLHLHVQDSPFVQGWKTAAAGATAGETGGAAAGGPLCAPITGMFSALATLLLQGPVAVTETACAARHQHSHGTCHFTARLLNQP